MIGNFHPQEAWMLLEVVRLSAGHPQLRNLRDAALSQLDEMNASLGPEPNEDPAAGFSEGQREEPPAEVERRA